MPDKYNDILGALMLCESIALIHALEPDMGLKILYRVRDRIESLLPGVCDHGELLTGDCAECVLNATFYGTGVPYEHD